ncbi:MAG: glycosyltransferase family 2 protein [Candidatus Nanohaloarchaea archaeon]
METISVVIPSYNNVKSLDRTLNSLQKQNDLNLDIIIVDDNSSEPYDIDSAKVLRNDENNWDPYSRNRGIAEADGDYILITDDDIEFVQDDWIQEAVDRMEEVNADIIFPKKYDQVDGEQREVSTFRMRSFDGSPRPVHREEGEVTYGCMTYLARKEVFDEIGGYDTVYGKKKGYSWMSESDVHARAAEAGFNLYYYPEIEIIHHLGEDPEPGIDSEREYWVAHNQVVFNARNLRFGWLRVAGYILYDVLAANIIYRRLHNIRPQLTGALSGIRDAILREAPGR